MTYYIFIGLAIIQNLIGMAEIKNFLHVRNGHLQKFYSPEKRYAYLSYKELCLHNGLALAGEVNPYLKKQIPELWEEALWKGDNHRLVDLRVGINALLNSKHPFTTIIRPLEEKTNFVQNHVPKIFLKNNLPLFPFEELLRTQQALAHSHKELERLKKLELIFNKYEFYFMSYHLMKNRPDLLAVHYDPNLYEQRALELYNLGYNVYDKAFHDNLD